MPHANPATPWKILLVDDNDDDLFLIRDILEEDWPGDQPPAVLTASNFHDAVRKIEADSFDLCLFDYRLGPEDGLELLETVRNRGCVTPVILLTGQGDEEIAVAAMKAGVADYIPKRRLTPELLHHAVRYVIEMNRAELMRFRAELALKESEERYRELVTTIPAAICELELDGRVLFVNPAVLEISGYRESELLGRNWWEIFQVDPAIRRRAGELACRENPEQSKRVELTIQAKDGSRRILNWNVSCRIDSSTGQLKNLVCVGVDISELVQLREELKELAITDELTGLLNRRGFITLAAHQIRLAQRQKKDLYLVYIDLDNMKEINDNLGHELGDAALRETTAVLRETFRESDVLGRLGGDEFAVLVAGTPGQDRIGIRHRLEGNLVNHPHSHPFKLEASIGVARLRAGEKMDLDRLIKEADDLMYEEKERHRRERCRQPAEAPAASGSGSGEGRSA